MQERDYKRELYDAYKTERKDLNGTALTISERYDKNILLVGGGALAVSLTFLEKIAPKPEGWLLLIIGASWACLVLSILAHLMALASGQRAIRKQMELLDSDYSRYLSSDTPETEIVKEIEDTTNVHSERTGFLSQIALCLVVVGVGLLCLFSVVSLTKKGSNHDPAKANATATAPATKAAAKRDEGILHSSDELPATTAPTQKAVVIEANK